MVINIASIKKYRTRFRLLSSSKTPPTYQIITSGHWLGKVRCESMNRFSNITLQAGFSITNHARGDVV
jgi:hypothetical protein